MDDLRKADQRPDSAKTIEDGGDDYDFKNIDISQMPHKINPESTLKFIDGINL